MLVYIVSSLIIMPPLVFFLVFKLTKRWYPKKKRVHVAGDATTLLFVFAVYFLLRMQLMAFEFYHLLLFLCSMFLLFVILHWKLADEIKLMKVWKGFWRSSFLLFSTAYIILIVLGIATRMFHAFS
ncbi:DUF3397 domain-containing protein [Aureibacillus halotolerans]|uniref:Uncharacterized protein DUF3397 n=1 Tax=Aureibacillus halotolerans TaxID=1508390 RepID=A0A4R6UC37_9BACI|nr:DUF3397 domain-containing protein [Aureibacillus halotolerans]TDQ42315.1 uncharacterized protein DUF3397 [Aureibacillus halotolerans]